MRGRPARRRAAARLVHGDLSVYLRQRGSPESEPAGEPHDSTGVSG
ncbi:MAG TPA: DUF6766 family protein [Arthrobacter sp.]|nr:DUF6766 family protein [Arthrobacter sp.]